MSKLSEAIFELLEAGAGAERKPSHFVAGKWKSG